jgi:hypothetical protein
MTITLTREEAQSVLDALQCVTPDWQKAVETLRSRIAQPEREWQGLTETEKEMLWDEAVEGREHFCSQYGNFADAIEAKLKEKNT